MPVKLELHPFFAQPNVHAGRGTSGHVARVIPEA